MRIRSTTAPACLLVYMAFVVTALADEPHEFDGRKKCSSCHKSGYRSWKKTAHARALEDLKPGVKAKRNALPG